MICALLSWFDEDPAMLNACVRSLGMLDVACVVAVDGSYALYGGEPTSPPDQRDAVLEAAAAIDAVCVVHTRTTHWPGEVDKRAFMFRAGEAITAADDWYLVVDADEVVLTAPDNIADALEDAPNVACAGVLGESFGNIWSVGADDPIPTVAYGRKVTPLRCLFRAIRGLTVRGRHFDYLTPQGLNLWGDGGEPALPMRGLMLDHRDFDRDADRNRVRAAYYQARDSAGIERRPTAVT